MRTIGVHLRHNLVAYLALFVALGGVSYAAVDLARDSVGKPEIAPDAVAGSEVAEGAIRSGEVRNGSLRCDDFKLSEDACPADPSGETAGEFSFDSATVRAHTETVELTCGPENNPFEGFYQVACQGEEVARASCNPGEVATGGSYREPGSQQNQGAGATTTTVPDGDRPDPSTGTPTGWSARVVATGSNTASTPGVPPPPNPEVTVYVVCVS